MIKRTITIIVLTALAIGATGSTAKAGVDRANLHVKVTELVLSTQIADDVAVYTTVNDLVIDLKEKVAAVSIYDITGREVYHLSSPSLGRLYISKDKLPQAPSLLLVRIVNHEGMIKTYKIRL